MHLRPPAARRRTGGRRSLWTICAYPTRFTRATTGTASRPASNRPVFSSTSVRFAQPYVRKSNSGLATCRWLHERVTHRHATRRHPLHRCVRFPAELPRLNDHVRHGSLPPGRSCKHCVVGGPPLARRNAVLRDRLSRILGVPPETSPPRVDQRMPHGRLASPQHRAVLVDQITRVSFDRVINTSNSSKSLNLSALPVIPTNRASASTVSSTSSSTSASSTCLRHA